MNEPLENVDSKNLSIEDSKATKATEVTKDYDEFLHLSLFSNYDQFIAEVNDKSLCVEEKRNNKPSKNFKNHEKSITDPDKDRNFSIEDSEDPIASEVIHEYEEFTAEAIDKNLSIEHNKPIKTFNSNEKCGSSIVKFIANPNNKKYKIINMKSKKECKQSEYRQLISSFIEIKFPGEYSCKACNFTSAEKGKLRKHAETHNGNFLFICNKCEETFTKEHMAQIHMMRSHPNKEEQKTQTKHTETFKKEQEFI